MKGMIKRVCFCMMGSMFMLSTGVAWAVTLEWDAPAVGVPQGYTVYRQVVSNGTCGTAIVPNFEVKGSTLVSVREFTDSSPVIGANYYHVTAYNVGGESLPSNQVCFQSVQVSSSPQNLRIR